MAGSTRTMSPVLKIRDFRLMILARGLILLALQMQALLVGWEVYHLRSNTLLLGFLGLAEAAPAIVCSFFSGHVVDHHRPSMIYRLSLATLCLNATVLFVATLPSTPLSADQRLVFLFTAVFVSGIVRSFVVPSSFALLPHIVPRPLFLRQRRGAPAPISLPRFWGLFSAVLPMAGWDRVWLSRSSQSLVYWALLRPRHGRLQLNRIKVITRASLFQRVCRWACGLSCGKR